MKCRVKDFIIVKIKYETIAKPSKGVGLRIVSDFMNKGIVHLGPDRGVIEAIELMKEKHIDAILIEDHGKTVGIFTERDLLTRVNFRDPRELASLKLKDVMTENLKMVDYREPYTHVIELMRTHNIRHTPVVENGQVVGMVSLRDLLTHYEENLIQMLRDNEEKLLEILNKIKESEERFRTVFNNSAVAITLTDKNEKIVAWNPFAANLLEMDEEDLKDKAVKDLYLPEEWQRIRSLNIRKLGMRHHLETQVLNQRGELIDVDISISVLKDGLGNITGSIGIMRDIRERKKTENELQKYREHLEEMVEKRTTQLKFVNEQLKREIHERKKIEEDLRIAYEDLQKAQHQLIQSEKMQVVGELATGVAHEVKNPLMIIQQGIGYLSKKIQTEDQDILLAFKHMDSAVQRADHIVRQLLDFASISELNLTKINVNDALKEALAFIKHHLLKNRIEVKNEYQDRLPLVELDKNKMEQVFIDLFLNAIAAMPGGGTLKVRTHLGEIGDSKEQGVQGKVDAFKMGDKALFIEIEDTGSGIPEEILGKIFDPFFTTKRTQGGTGMGLPVVKNIVHIHGGTISIANRKDIRGVKVTVKLKLKLSS